MYENGLAYDIFSQVGALLKSESRSNPLGVAAKRVYLTGESQSANYVVTYFKYIHNLTKDKRGRPVYDGYLTEAAITPAGAPINQCVGTTNPLPTTDPQRLTIPGRGVPLVMIQSQWDYFPFRANPRKPDSNTPTDKTRTWELAGSNHGWKWQYDYGDAALVDLTKAGFEQYNWTCPVNRPEVPLYMAEKALYLWLDLWVTRGIAPPTADVILTANGDEVYDQYGNAEGGLRFPMISVPIASYGEGHFFLSPNCEEIVPFTSDVLTALYPKPHDYLKQYVKATEGLMRGGFLLNEDARKLIQEAKQRNIP
ncbi:MAG: alpha/beta hydrolase domain-containing protein [Gammaproteobacteria bacterium]